ncbi:MULTISPECIES: 3-methyl-2-oxobutanoate hydroxymethyltransferase [Dethiosulfovibrio]|uniref:3-methyl-2-oxobutanoate hydroxymethyltransferase n=2 Tax=Dethiosulfovibrio TaxID=47054 RepID=A0ABS9ERI8_9BACT|nr:MULTISPECIES: 3-methyl-2-oxobutanoate hydroxymethyltransferase [Dethiosulfovibrio]MCF4113373.1 3-methyl-2-oxobutanoate hydroxymethyltransferase [Dethiosulfovibrio russensis]MCF4142490.1 3-methyl-2-oxobutanoate hydroxymethyltransferase [Dethiosulfovibrio marinus]MCF4145886.1 3-methyl-2-oxobutanoate hydroxymethyltransferase [Dethiosulfovibrio acidaminovorans]MEA3283944.1 3-methyl-2-oxobutanoate hydroxymethyltransferase [Synergistota bacterium]
MAKKKTRLDFVKMKREGEKATWITAYDFPTASFAQQAGMDMILVGDSMGMVLLGYDGTVPVTMEECLIHCRAVRRGAPDLWCMGDMPFGSYQVSDEDAVINAIRFLKEADMDCVKLEGGRRVCSRIKAITDAGILVCGHIGLTPQSSGQLGGFKAQGRDPESARELIKDAIAVQDAGAYALLLEAVPPELTEFIAKKLEIPVYSIGAGAPCDGQLIICGDMLGLFQAFTPKFVKKYANVAEVEIAAFKEYVQDVKKGRFPTDDHVYHIHEGMEEDFQSMLREFDLPTGVV